MSEKRYVCSKCKESDEFHIVQNSEYFMAVKCKKCGEIMFSKTMTEYQEDEKACFGEGQL